jgi:hypothetical protein
MKILNFFFEVTFCYYSLKLNKIYNQQLVNENYSIEYNQTLEEELNKLKENIDFPSKYSDFNSIVESYIRAKNINSEQYTITLYFGSNKQYFRLLLSTIDDYTTISSINCTICNVSNKYNSILSNSYIKLNNLTDKTGLVKNYNYEFFHDSCFIPTQSKKNDITEKKSINISLNFKVIEFDSSGFLNSNLSDGILGLNYNNDSELPNMNFIKELYNNGHISSPSFSIIITSSNINRLYLGDIMENEYIKNYLNSSMNKGDCKIIDNNWKCELKGIEYNALKYLNWEKLIYKANSTVSFNLKENKLTIPEKYFELIVVSYIFVKNKRKRFNKFCYVNNQIIYCSCKDKDDFGIVTFHFDGYSKLDIDIRDYVYFNKNEKTYKCVADIVLSKNNEFIVGLKGLNNTILSFNMEEKKVKFFHKTKIPSHRNYFLIAGIIIFIIGLIINENACVTFGLILIIISIILNFEYFLADLLFKLKVNFF